MSYRKDSYRSRPSYVSSSRGRATFNESLKITIGADEERNRRHRSPDWQDSRQSSVGWHDERKSFPKWQDGETRSARRDTGLRGRVDNYGINNYNQGVKADDDYWNSNNNNRREERSFNSGEGYKGFDDSNRLKRKFQSDSEGYGDSFRNDSRKNDGFNTSHDSPFVKRPHFQSSSSGFRGRDGMGARGRGRPFNRSFGARFDFHKNFDSFREHRMNQLRESRRRYRSRSRSRGRSTDKHKKDSSKHRSKDREKKDGTSTNGAEKKSHIAAVEEKEIETQVIDENLFKKMTIDQRDFIASKALGILLSKPDEQCKLNELEYDLMDIKIMFVSSELFLEFLQSFIDDDNVFEIIETETVPESLSEEEKNGDDKVKEESNEQKDNTEKKEESEDNGGEEKKGDETEDEKMDEDLVERDDLTQLENIIIARPKLRLCYKYCTNIYSCKTKCDALHVCRFHILSKCIAPEGRTCIFSHNLNSNHNQEALRHNLLHTVSEETIKQLLCKFKFRSPSTLPPICWYYNVNKGCNKWSAGNCHFVHLCQSLLEGKKTCSEGEKCKLIHDLKKNSEALMKYGMWSPEFSLEDIMHVISENFIKHDEYANRKPTRETQAEREQREDRDYYSKRGIPKPQWQLYVPHDDTWVNLIDKYNRRIEGKHRALVRAQAEYEETLEDLKRHKAKDLIGRKEDMPKMASKDLRRLVPELSLEEGNEQDKKSTNDDEDNKEDVDNDGKEEEAMEDNDDAKKDEEKEKEEERKEEEEQEKNVENDDGSVYENQETETEKESE